MEHGIIMAWAAASTVLMIILATAVIGLRIRHRAHVARMEDVLGQKEKEFEDQINEAQNRILPGKEEMDLRQKALEDGLTALEHLLKRAEEVMEERERALEEKQTKALRLGQSTIRGELTQILGQFAILNEYERLASVSSVSRQFSLDLLGIGEDSVDFIEVKSPKTPLSPNEKKVQRLIEAKKVRYRVIEGHLPEGFSVGDRNRRGVPTRRLPASGNPLGQHKRSPV